MRFPAGEARGVVLLACILALALLVTGAPRVDAQAGTPTPAPDVATPAECTVAPRPEDELRALFRESAATPIPVSLAASPAPTAPAENCHRRRRRRHRRAP